MLSSLLLSCLLFLKRSQEGVGRKERKRKRKRGREEKRVRSHMRRRPR
jgi:hypothetical protein